MNEPLSFVDIHCHLLLGIDDGAQDWDDSLAMAEMAVADGIGTIVATPHQLGNFRQNQGDTIRALALELQERLDQQSIPLRVLPGGDVRIESDLPNLIKRGEVLSLADHKRHVLLELPHELYMPLEKLVEDLGRAGITGILSHPERNQGILAQPHVVRPLVEAGCLMQITAGSLLGGFGAHVQKFSDWLLEQGLVHFISTDAHGTKSRRPLLRSAFERAEKLVGRETAIDLCSRNPRAVAEGRPVATQVQPVKRTLRNWFAQKAV